MYSTCNIYYNSCYYNVARAPRACKNINEFRSAPRASGVCVCTVTVVHSKTRDLKTECQKADILVAAVGVANLVKGDWVKQNSIIIDVGINKVGDKIVGDVEFDTVKDKAKAITPVPGGVGPMTIACLLKNTLECFKDR